MPARMKFFKPSISWPQIHTDNRKSEKGELKPARFLNRAYFLSAFICVNLRLRSYNARERDPHTCRFSRCTGQISARNAAPRSFDCVGVCGQIANSATRARALFDDSDGRLQGSSRLLSLSQVSLLVTNDSLHHRLLSFNELNRPREIQTPQAHHHSR
jgi:hypothetical protein